MELEDYGYNYHFLAAFEQVDMAGLRPGRIVLASGEIYRLVTEDGEHRASVSGRLRHEAASAKDLPAVGDWVGFRDSRIEAVLPRRTQLSRKVAGRRTAEQVVAANVDIVIIVMGLDGDFNPRRLERYLTTVWKSGAAPAVLLNKADLAEAVDARKAEIEEIALGARVLVSSCLDGLDGLGLDEVRALLRPRETTVLVGSSGVGKSTLINRLLDENVQATREVRQSDDRGRHTTTRRELFRMPGGALLIDNPGIRELQLWAEESALDRSFEDIARLAEACRYEDCAHQTEPGCAVLAAADSGELSPERLEGFRRLQKELRHLRVRQDASAQRAEKQKWRAIHREMRRSGRHRRT